MVDRKHQWESMTQMPLVGTFGGVSGNNAASQGDGGAIDHSVV